MKPNSVHTLVRRSHLVLGLFLSPWVLMYAISTFTMHHRALFTGSHTRVAPPFDLVQKTTLPTPFKPGTSRESAAAEILKQLELTGAHSVQGQLAHGQITIHRDHPLRSYRIQYTVDTGQIRVERQRFGLAFALEMLHRRSGFQHPFWTNDLWALVVDLVIISILLWAMTGLWMWWRMAKCRGPGFLCLGAGTTLFILFMLTL